MARRGRLRAKSASTHPAIKFPRKKLHQQLLPLLHLLLLHIIAINHIGKVYGGSQPPPPPQKTNSWKLCTSAAKLLPPKIQSGHHHPLLLHLL